MARHGIIAVTLALVGLACGDDAKEAAKAQPGATDDAGAVLAPRDPSCPAFVPAEHPLPGTAPEHLTLDYWLARTARAADLDEVLLTPEEIADLNASQGQPRSAEFHPQNDLAQPVDAEAIRTQVKARLTFLRDKLAAGEYVAAGGAKLDGAALAAFDPEAAVPPLAPQLRVALDLVPLRCGPHLAPLYAAASLARGLDRNSCSVARAQEPIQILAEWPGGGAKLARTRQGTGWIAADAPLSPPVPEELARTLLHGERVQLMGELSLEAPGGARAHVPDGALLAAVPKRAGRVWFATAAGVHESAPLGAGRVRSTLRPLTRRAVLEEAFRYLGTPYGWGNQDGGRDCSGMLLDLFAAFDLRLPRHSNWQALAGSYSIDVSKVTSDRERLVLIDAAAKKGVVLLHFPAHIMLYLGRNDAGAPMALHALAEYVSPCEGVPPGPNGETLNAIPNISVSTLELGRGSTRRALIERITRVTVIGKPPGVELAGVAELRPAAPVVVPSKGACRDGGRASIFVTPRYPNSREPLRIIATTSRDPGPAELALVDAQGRRVATQSVRLGGPPFTVLATLDAPPTGTFTAVLGDGARVDACQKITVRAKLPYINTTGTSDEPVWFVRNQWSPPIENLYSVFVQRLFDFPLDQEVTFKDLHTLLRDPAHNILHNYLGLGEDEILTLVPDCAELPYFLRAYFAWKMGLPVGYRSCTRGTAKRAPDCQPVVWTNMMPRWQIAVPGLETPKLEATLVSAQPPPVPPAPGDLPPDATVAPPTYRMDDVKAFERFVEERLGRTIHSSSGRTLPDDEETDYYPVPLTREAIRPGIAYHDPYGHVMIVAGWVPQAAGSYGVLLAADAQPDGTVGRKRFWRGNFLFTTDTRVAGAGFKAFRPLVWHRPTRTMEIVENRVLRHAKRYPRLSEQQYEGSVDDFYDTMEGLVNPRPLDPAEAQRALVDSLLAQASLRVVSVKNGEDYMLAHPGEVIPLPDGSDIFLTSGPWEDFATPSRDLRLLIAIDTVLAFPASVRRAPARFGVEPAQVDAVVADLEKRLAEELAARKIAYVRSDGATQELTLADLVARREALEVSYNPNDCVELRWGAPEGSAELASCRRRSPEDQRARMAGDYRAWFSKRQRPPR